jgi:hypothetical protein
MDRLCQPVAVLLVALAARVQPVAQLVQARQARGLGQGRSRDHLGSAHQVCFS